MRLTWLPLLLAALTLPASAQVVPVARHNAAGNFELWLAPTSGAPAVLVAPDVAFVPLQLAGFAVRDRLRIDLARPVSGAPAAHVQLAGGGSVYRVRGLGHTALLHVRPDGGLDVPFVAPDAGGPSIAALACVATDAPLLLLATTPAAGGQVWLASLAGAPARLLSPPGAAAVDPTSLRVSGARAFFVAGGVLHAADLSAPGPASPLVLGAGGDTVLPELAISDDGLSVAAVTEDAGGLRQVHVVDPALQPHQITTTAGLYDTPNDDSPFGPWLVLSPDGSQVAFRGTVGPSAEVFLRDVPQSAPPVQLTATANFIDTIDNVGVLGFAAGGLLHFMAGEKVVGGLVGQIGAADVYQAQPLGGGNVALANVTQTSGVPVPPFTAKGNLEVSDQMLDPLGQNLLLVVDPHGADSGLAAVPLNGSAGVSMLLPALAAVPELHPVGDSVLVVSQPCKNCAFTLQRLAPGAILLPLGSLPVGVTLDRFAWGGGRAAFVANAGAGASLAARVELSTGAFDVPWPFVGAVSGGITLDPLTGALRLGAGGVAGPPLLFLQLDGPLSGHLLKLPVGDGLPLDT